MTDNRIELEHVVQAPVERVWEVLTDIARADQTLEGVERVELLTEGPTAWARGGGRPAGCSAGR